MTPDTDSLRDFIQDQIQGLGEVEFRHMFGGYGLYRGDVFFGILYKDRLYFRTDQASRQAYVDRGMRPFRPSVKQTLKNYYEVPPDIVEDSEALVAWARSIGRINALFLNGQRVAHRRWKAIRPAIAAKSWLHRIATAEHPPAPPLLQSIPTIRSADPLAPPSGSQPRE